MKNIFWLQNATSLSLSVMEHYLWFIEAKNCKVKIFIFFSLKWTSCEVREGGQPERWNVYWNKVIREFRAEEHFVMSGKKFQYCLRPTFGRANGRDKHLFTKNPSIHRSRERNYLGFLRVAKKIPGKKSFFESYHENPRIFLRVAKKRKGYLCSLIRLEMLCCKTVKQPTTTKMFSGCQIWGDH